MLFNSIDFLLFFPIVSVIFFLIPAKIRNIFLLVASFYFYMCWKASYIVLIGFSILVTYIAGVMIDYCRDKLQNKKLAKTVMILAILANLAVLFLFKYYNFFIENISAVSGFSLPLLRFALPVGISFYTFQALGYVIDVYQEKVPAEKNLITYALFISFYPQLVAGPIERSGNLLQQIKTPKSFQYENMRSGLLLMAYGFFQKLVIADRLSLFVNSVYADYKTIDGAYLLLATIVFAIQIYCDFASYSNIAIGAARVMGYKLMTNFKAPYFSKSISEFWSRWHISLSTWFQDYIFNPIVWSNKDPQQAIYLGVIVVFLISGFWHGANWTFVVWGIIHALYRVLEIALRKPKKQFYKAVHINTKSKFFHFTQVLTTFLLVCFTYIFFRAESISQAIQVIYAIIARTNISSLFTSNFLQYGLDIPDLVIAAISLVILFIADTWTYKGVDVYEKIVQKNRFNRWCIYWVIIFTILIFGIYGPNYDASPFIYFQF